MNLKYGMNPNQKQAEVVDSPHLNVLNGSPSMINFLDALNSWPLVKELKEATGKSSAASFKHVTPSGTAVARELTPGEISSYHCAGADLSPLATAYLRARGSDRLASFGDFIALSDTVDASAARIIKTEVSDGIIAPGYDDEALEILKAKKKGNYVIMQIDPEYDPSGMEERTVFGVTLKQERNTLKITPDMLKDIKTSPRDLSPQVIENLLVGLITLKYTQSNSLCAVYNGQAIGIGSGQQSRILCSELALTKANRWCQKTQMDFDKVNPLLAQAKSRTEKDMILDDEREKALGSEKVLSSLDSLCLCSDAFFPQTDNIDLANSYGVQYIASAMGSIRDQQIIELCNKLDITFLDIHTRLFHH